MLRSYFKVTQSIAGCQALRRRIGHCLFGFRVVFGECFFITVSPNRRWSHLIMRLSRTRRNDPMADEFLRPSSGHVKYRRTHAGSSSPPLFAELDDDRDVELLFTEYEDMTSEEKKRGKRESGTCFPKLGASISR